MEVIISVDGIKRMYRGDYYQLHNYQWDDYVRDLLDSVADMKTDPEDFGSDEF